MATPPKDWEKTFDGIKKICAEQKSLTTKKESDSNKLPFGDPYITFVHFLLASMTRKNRAWQVTKFLFQDKKLSVEKVQELELSTLADWL